MTISAKYTWSDSLDKQYYRVIVDDKDKAMYIYDDDSGKTERIPYSEIIGFEILTDDQISGGAGRALVGSVLAGEIGAIVGASTGKNRKIVSYKGVLYRENIKHPDYTFELINRKINVDDNDYIRAQRFAESINSTVKAIISQKSKGLIHRDTLNQQQLNGAEKLDSYSGRINQQPKDNPSLLGQQVFYQENPQQYIDSPVRIQSVSLCKIPDSILCKICFINQSKSDIIGIIVGIRAYNIAGESVDIPRKRYIFQDMKISSGEEYGTNNAIPFPDDVRAVTVAIEKVVFSNRNVWDSKNSSVSSSIPLKTIEVEKQYDSYVSRLLKSKGIDSYKYYYLENSEAWLCSCGRINSITTATCAFCNAKQAIIKSNLSYHEFQKTIEQAIKQKQEDDALREWEKAEAEKVRAEKERIRREEQINLAIKEKNAKKRRRQNIFLFVLGLIVSCLLAWIYISEYEPILSEKIYNSIVAIIPNKLMDKRILCFNNDGSPVTDTIILSNNSWYEINDSLSVRFDEFKLSSNYYIEFIYSIKVQLNNEESVMYKDSFHGTFTPGQRDVGSIVSIYNHPMGCTRESDYEYSIHIKKQYLSTDGERNYDVSTYTFNFKHYLDYCEYAIDNEKSIVCYKENGITAKAKIENPNNEWIVTNNSLFGMRLSSIESMGYPIVKLCFSFGYYDGNRINSFMNSSVELDLSSKIPDIWSGLAGIAFGRNIENVFKDTDGKYNFSIPVYIFWNGRCIEDSYSLNVELADYEKITTYTLPPVNPTIEPQSTKRPSSLPDNTPAKEHSSSKNSYYHKCQAGGCSKEGLYSIKGITGQTEYYCYEHLQEMKSMIERMIGS